MACTKFQANMLEWLAHRCTCPKAPPNPTQCHKRHACHANATSMSPRATPRKTKVDVLSDTPATQSAAAPRATNGLQARHQIQPSVISATPAAQNESWCEQVPRLPRKTKFDVTKRRTCHGKCRVKDGVWQSCVCVCDKVMWRRTGGGREGEQTGHRNKNKNPTQRRGEQT